jgi:hypothetical protein
VATSVPGWLVKKAKFADKRNAACLRFEVVIQLLLKQTQALRFVCMSINIIDFLKHRFKYFDYILISKFIHTEVTLDQDN